MESISQSYQNINNPSRLTAAFSCLKLIQFILTNLLTIVRYSLNMTLLKRNNALLIGDREMAKSINTQENRDLILDTIESHGVNLSEFSEEQKVEIIKTYAAMLYSEGLVK